MGRIIIPTPLRKFTANQSTFDTNKSNVGEAIGQLVEEHSDLKKHLLDADGNIRSFIRVYLGEDDIKSLNGEQTAFAENDVVSIVPAIAGGSN